MANSVPERQKDVLARSMQLQQEAAGFGFDWPQALDVLDKIREEVDELEALLHEPKADTAAQAAELGDLLFAVLNLARKLSLDPLAALELTHEKFHRRFACMCQAAGGQEALRALPLTEQEALWQAAKRQE